MLLTDPLLCYLLTLYCATNWPITLLPILCCLMTNYITWLITNENNKETKEGLTKSLSFQRKECLQCFSFCDVFSSLLEALSQLQPTLLAQLTLLAQPMLLAQLMTWSAKFCFIITWPASKVSIMDLQTCLPQISYLCTPVTKIVYFPPKWGTFQILFAHMGNSYYRLWPNAHTHLETLKTQPKYNFFNSSQSEPQRNTMQEPIYFSLYNWS